MIIETGFGILFSTTIMLLQLASKTKHTLAAASNFAQWVRLATPLWVLSISAIGPPNALSLESHWCFQHNADMAAAVGNNLVSKE